jgi:hypothetical protein
MGWFVGWLVGVLSLVRRMVSRRCRRMVPSLDSTSDGSFVEWLVRWFVGWFVGWFIGGVVGWFVGECRQMVRRGCRRMVCRMFVGGVVGRKGIGVTYGKLHDFFRGLAAVFPGTQLVESDFSFLKMTSGKHSTNLTDLSLESKLHAKRFLELQKIKPV